jgi:hypothetical protein
MTKAPQTAFQTAATQTVELGDAATAYVFFPAGDRKGMVMRPSNVFFESSDTEICGGERHDTDHMTKTPEDCKNQANTMVAKMLPDTQPKAVVFVHEPHRFDFNNAAVAAKIQQQAITASKPQQSTPCFWQRMMNRCMP